MKHVIDSKADLAALAAWDVTDNPAATSPPPLFSAKELYESEVICLRPLIQDLLWDGLTMLIAPPKAGKSWLALQAAVHIAGGRQVQGLAVLDNGPVLYAALEEPKARTMNRLRKLASKGQWTEKLHFVYELLPLMGGGVEQLAELVQQLRPRLIIVDTFTSFAKTASKGNDVFRSQYAEVSRLRKLAEAFSIAILVVHHARKRIAESCVEAVAGTGGIAAAVDTLWQLKRKPEGEGILEVIGRECEERVLAMRFAQDPVGWEVLGDYDGQHMTAERKEILDLLKDDGGLTPAQIAMELGKARPAVRMLLKRMREDGHVKKQGTKYFPTHSVGYSVTDSA